MRSSGKHRPTTEEHEHSVWDEPGLSRELSGAPPPDAPSYGAWLDRMRSRTSPGKSVAVTIGIALAAGPWALLGTLWNSAPGLLTIPLLVVVGPLLEEVMKIALPVWVVEKRPYLFRSRAQIAACALASGLVFAAIENLLYLGWHIPDPDELIVWWRWSVCTTLHAGCALIASLGLMRAWDRTLETQRPRAPLESCGFLILAAAIHGSYNATMVLVEQLELGF